MSTEITSGQIIDVGFPSEPNSLASIAEVSGLSANLNRAEGIIDAVVSNLYMVMSAKHEASAFTKKWHTMIEAKMFVPNTRGVINNV